MRILTRLGQRIEQESTEERQRDEKRVVAFQKRFPRLSHRSMIGPLSRFVVRENWIALLILCTILFGWTLIKLPYFSYNFTGEHELKYNSYVEPALHMVEMGNPFWNQKKYLANPVTNPQGIFQEFSHIPLLEWSLAGTYVLLPHNAIEWNTRLVTHFFGLLTLLIAYIFLRYWTTKSVTLLAITLLALNPIITFSSYVTVYDGLLLLCTFLTLALLSHSFVSRDPAYLMSAGLAFGLGFAMKDSLGVWLIPAVILLLWLRRDSLAQFVSRTIYFALFAIIPYLMHLSAIRHLPMHAQSGLSILLVWMILVLVLVRYRLYLYERYCKIFAYVQKHKVAHALFWIITIAMVSMYWIQSRNSQTAQEFLTDKDLIVYWPMYQELLHQFRNYLTTPVFWFGIIGIVMLPLLYRTGGAGKRISQMIAVLGVSSLIYFVAASKVIFFHNYYTLIALVFFCFLVAAMLRATLWLLPKKIFNYLILLHLLVWFFPISHASITEHLERQRLQYDEALAYLQQQTSPDDIFIDESFVMSLTIGSGRASFANVDILNDTKLEDSIAKRGLAKTMQAYNIRYIISANAEPDYARLAPLFTDQELESSYYRRTDIIKSRLDPEYAFFTDQSLRDEIVQESRLKDKFHLEYSTGYYNFFSFDE